MTLSTGKMATQDIILKDIPPRTISYLRCRGAWRQIPEMLAKLNEYTSRSGVEITGPASGIYYNTPSEVSVQDLEWEVFYPIALDTPELVENEYGFGIRNIPRVKVATIVHHGSYRRAKLSYERLEEWIQSEGLKVSGPAEEAYLTDITDTKGDQRIEIRLPIHTLN